MTEAEKAWYDKIQRQAFKTDHLAIEKTDVTVDQAYGLLEDYRSRLREEIEKRISELAGRQEDEVTQSALSENGRLLKLLDTITP